jgi:hypothetical protein
VPASHVVSEYGMTELGSQYYTLSLRAALLGAGAAGGGADAAAEPTVWSAPAWLRPRLVHAASGQAVDVHEAREPGLLAHHDLANRATVAHWLTADLGEPLRGSFVLRGRSGGAERRGCGLVFERPLAGGAGAPP